MRLNYDDLCKSPNKSLSRIGHAVEKAGGDLTVSPVRESLRKLVIGMMETNLKNGSSTQKAHACY